MMRQRATCHDLVTTAGRRKISALHACQGRERKRGGRSVPGKLSETRARENEGVSRGATLWGAQRSA